MWPQRHHLSRLWLSQHRCCAIIRSLFAFTWPFFDCFDRHLLWRIAWTWFDKVDARSCRCTSQCWTLDRLWWFLMVFAKPCKQTCGTIGWSDAGRLYSNNRSWCQNPSCDKQKCWCDGSLWMFLTYVDLSVSHVEHIYKLRLLQLMHL